MAEEENNNTQYYTKEGYKKLVDEFEYLKGEKMEEVKQRLAEARSFGDLSENSEYDEAKNEQTKVYSRITELEQVIKEAKILDDKHFKAGIVNINSVVTVKDLDQKKEFTYTIVNPNEVDVFEGKISQSSPLGKSMMGQNVGDSFTVETPAGVKRYKIISSKREKK